MVKNQTLYIYSIDSQILFYQSQLYKTLYSSFLKENTIQFEQLLNGKKIKIKGKDLEIFYEKIYSKLKSEINSIDFLGHANPHKNPRDIIIYFEGKKVELLTSNRNHDLIYSLNYARTQIEKVLCRGKKIEISIFFN